MIELNDFQTDALCECINIGVGDSAAVLSELAGEAIELQIPTIRTIRLSSVRDHLDSHYNKWHSCVLLEFHSKFSGDAILIFSAEAADGWAELIINHQFDGEIELTNDMKSDFLLEIGNIIINGCIGSMANMMQVECDFSIPHIYNKITSDLFDDMLDRDQKDHFGMIVTTTLKAEGKSVTTDLFLTLKEDSIPFFIESVDALLEC
jgi:chemotaxis protein CheC